jgi:response regulator NasT
LEQALRDNGCDVVARLSTHEDLLVRLDEVRPDVIIIDMESPDRDTLESLRSISRDQPRPIVMFAEQSDSGTIEEAVRAGVSAYVVDGMSGSRMRPIIDVAIARFREYQALRQELEETKTKLADRKDVDKAKGILMQRKGIGEDEAYAALRKMAMDRNIKIGEAARTLIAAAELLGG